VKDHPQACRGTERLVDIAQSHVSELARQGPPAAVSSGRPRETSDLLRLIPARNWESARIADRFCISEDLIRLPDAPFYGDAQ
jgi:hypothetical protein